MIDKVQEETKSRSGTLYSHFFSSFCFLFCLSRGGEGVMFTGYLVGKFTSKYCASRNL